MDGGSTDGTPEQIRREYPHVEVLQDQKELWWGEAMQLGIEHCLRHSRRDDDMLLMMNNDTLIEPDYVATLVRVSQEQNAAVGGAIVDSANPSRVLDAGEFIDWDTYSFPVKTVREPGETYVDEVDLLSGRGTLVPLRMVLQAGNVNGARFPHYIADCEFFSRLKRKGFRLRGDLGCRDSIPCRGDGSLDAPCRSAHLRRGVASAVFKTIDGQRGKPLVIYRRLRPSPVTEAIEASLDLAMRLSPGQSDGPATCRSSTRVVFDRLVLRDER